MLCVYFSNRDPAKAAADQRPIIRHVFEILFFEDPCAILEDEGNDADAREDCHPRLRILVLLVVQMDASMSNQLIIGHRGGVTITVTNAPWSRGFKPSWLPMQALADILSPQFQEQVGDDGARALWFTPRLNPYELAGFERRILVEPLVTRLEFPDSARSLTSVDVTPDQASDADGRTWRPYRSLEMSFPGPGTFLVAVDIDVIGENYARLVGNVGGCTTDGPSLVLACIDQIDLSDPVFSDDEWRADFEDLSSKQNRVVPEQYEIVVVNKAKGARKVQTFFRNASVVPSFRPEGDASHQWADIFIANTPDSFSVGLDLTTPAESEDAELRDIVRQRYFSSSLAGVMDDE